MYLMSWVIDMNTKTRLLRPAPIPYGHSIRGHSLTSPASTAVHGTPHIALIYTTNSNSLPPRKAPVESPSRSTLRPKLSTLYVEMNKPLFQAKITVNGLTDPTMTGSRNCYHHTRG